MAYLSTSKLEAFAQLIARGWPPVLAGRRAGFAAMKRRDADHRPARPDVAAPVAETHGPAEPRAAARPKRPDSAPTPRPEPVDAQPPPRPPFRPVMTNEEWLAKYAPRPQDEAAA